MHKSHLLVTRYYLEVSYHYMKLKLTLGMSFHKKSWLILDQIGHATSSENMFCFLNYTVFLQNLLSPIFKFIVCVENDILIEELYTKKYFRKSHKVTFVTMSIESIHQRLSTM